jgi:putative transposase
VACRWRAVDHEGKALDIVAQRGRDKAAALKLMRKPLRKQGFAPTVLETKKLRPYPAAFAERGLAAYHERSLRQNNQADVFAPAGPPARAKDAAVQVSRDLLSSAECAPRVLDIHAAVHNTFHVQRHLISRRTLRLFRAEEALAAIFMDFIGRGAPFRLAFIQAAPPSGLLHSMLARTR